MSALLSDTFKLVLMGALIGMHGLLLFWPAKCSLFHLQVLHVICRFLLQLHLMHRLFLKIHIFRKIEHLLWCWQKGGEWLELSRGCFYVFMFLCIWYSFGHVLCLYLEHVICFSFGHVVPYFVIWHGTYVFDMVCFFYNIIVCWQVMHLSYCWFKIHIFLIHIFYLCGMWYFYFVYPIGYLPSTTCFRGWRHWRLEETVCAYLFVFLYSLYA